MGAITVDELATYLGKDLTGKQEQQAQMVIDQVQGDLEAFLGRPVEQTEITDESILLDGRRIYFSASPVVSVEEIKIDGVVVGASNYVVRKWGLDELLGFDVGITGDPPVLLATYIGGLDGPNIAAIKAILLRASARELTKLKDDAIGITSMIIEGYNVNYEETFPTAELARVRRYKRPKAW